MRQAATYPLALARVWIDRLRNAQAHHHAIAQGMVWVALFVLLTSLARAAREMAIAYRYGVGAEVDAYLFVFNLISWPASVWFSILTVVLVPLAARVQQGSPVGLPLFRGELLGFTVLLGLALTFLGWLGLPFLLRSSWTGLSSATGTIATNMVPSLILLVPLGLVIGLFSAWMLAAGRHTNTLLESVPALVLLIVLLAFPGGGAEPLVWGTLGGFALHMVTLGISLERRGEIEKPCFTHRSPQWATFWQAFGITLLGQALMSFTTIIDQFFAAHLGTGAIATLSYANRILLLILGLGATAVSRATLPVFSRAQAQGGQQLPHIAAHWVRLLFMLGVVAVVVSWWLAPWAVRLLFERGAFTAQNSEMVTEVFCYGLAQVPFYFSSIVLVSLLASQARYGAITTVSAIILVMKIVANFSIVPWLGLKGIVLGTAWMYAGSLLLCWLIVNRDS
jgi:putative peptidoglycan lipid II flippase